METSAPKVRHFERRAKIVATLGPATSTVESLMEMIEAGMNVVRLNMSHGSHEDHAGYIANVREASKRLGGREVAVLMDLQGPRIRVDKLAEPLTLIEGEQWWIGPTRSAEKHPERRDRFIPTVYEGLARDGEVGHRILFDDGLIIAHIVDKEEDFLKIEIKEGGPLKSNKGINLPDSIVSAPSYSEKDHNDPMFGLEHEIDYVALSFVRTRDDILRVKSVLNEQDRDVPVVAKIENALGLKNIEEILEVADVIMVARGDMGVELGNQRVPLAQKRLIRLCNLKGKPVITATQMLESMINNPTPTRAEASDVANAVWDGTDALMLSGETAAGKHPIDAVKMMDSIVEEAEKMPRTRPNPNELELGELNDAILMSAALIAEKIEAKRILSISESGRSCLRMGRFRPRTSVLGITNSTRIMRRMCLYWGVSPFYISDTSDHAGVAYNVLEQVRRECALQWGDKVVVTRGGGKFFSKGTSNSVRIISV